MDELCSYVPDDTRSVRRGREAKPGVLVATTYSHADRLARAYRLPVNPIESHWTGRGEQVRVWECPGGWKRTSGNAVAHHEAEYLHERHWEGARRVFTSTIEEWTPWRVEPIYVDQEQVERAHAAFAEIKQIHKERQTVQEHRRTLISSVEAQWRERAEAEAYARFIEDYADPSLWEGHRKTLKITYPRRVDRTLEHLVETLDEGGVEIAGMTVREAEAALPEPYGHRDDHMDSMLDFTFRLPEEPDEDEAAD